MRMYSQNIQAEMSVSFTRIQDIAGDWDILAHCSDRDQSEDKCEGDFDWLLQRKLGILAQD